VGSIAHYLDLWSWADGFQISLDALREASFWIGALQILLIDLLLSGDNAVVIALACRRLAPRQRLWGLLIGVTLAVVLRIVFAGVVTQLLRLPYLKLAGGIALLYIAAKLIAQSETDRNEIHAPSTLWRAVWVIVVADAVMSIDNILPIAAVARGNLALLVIGLAAAIPPIIIGAAFIMRIIDRFPILVWAGAALLGWIAGDLIATDPVVSAYASARFGETVAQSFATAAAGGGIVLVLAAGAVWRRCR
jgi:YjbE family integral membrane protein